MSETVVIVRGRTETVGARRQIQVVTVGRQGPPGRPGSEGPGGGTFEATAAEALGGHRVVISNGNDSVRYADAANPAHAGRVCGITTGAAGAGDPVTVRASGEMTEPSWAWQPGPVYLSGLGLLSQTPPTAGILVQIGVALSPTRLLVDLGDEYELV